MQAILRSALAPYRRLRNTGQQYEITAALHIGRAMGLSNADIVEMRPFFAEIRVMNPTFPVVFEQFLQTVPCGTGFRLEDQPVVGMRNVTQDDGDGGTGDFMFVLADGTERSISVKEGSVRGGKINVCGTNPSSVRFGCKAPEIERFKGIAARAVPVYCAEMKDTYGDDMDAWKRKKSAAADAACSEVARITCEAFNTYPSASQKKMLEDILGVTDDAKPADYLLLVSSSLKKFSMFSYGALKIDPASITIRPRSIYIEFVAGDKLIGQTQVKFNNGVYSKHRDGTCSTSAIHTSWNAVFSVNDCFEMRQVI
jgi:hypothetical protein